VRTQYNDLLEYVASHASSSIVTFYVCSHCNLSDDRHCVAPTLLRISSTRHCLVSNTTNTGIHHKYMYGLRGTLHLRGVPFYPKGFPQPFQRCPPFLDIQARTSCHVPTFHNYPPEIYRHLDPPTVAERSIGIHSTTGRSRDFDHAGHTFLVFVNLAYVRRNPYRFP